MRQPVGIGGRSLREEMLRLEERPGTRIGLGDPGKMGSGEAWAELGLGSSMGKFPSGMGQGPGIPSPVETFGGVCLPAGSLRTVSYPLWFITMPSDLAKKKAAKKKEAAKARQRPRKGHEENGDAVTEPQVAEEKNEANGRETTGEWRERWAPGMDGWMDPQARARVLTLAALEDKSGAAELFTVNRTS